MSLKSFKPLSEREKTIRFNECMDAVGGRLVPVLDDDENDGGPTITVEEDAEAVEAILRETTATFDPASGNMIVSASLAERQDNEDFRRARFNKHMAAVGGRQV